MPIERSFSEILESFREETVTNNLEYSSAFTRETSLEPAWMAQLMAEMSELKVIKSKKPLSYFYKRMTPLIARKPHILNEQEQNAYMALNSFSPNQLSICFTLHELKSIYRQALLKTHPDQGGTAESFQAARKSYEILRSLVTK